MKIKLCLFDLDNTLLRTDDLVQFRGRENVGNRDADYAHRLRQAAFEARKLPERFVYTQAHLADLRQKFPRMRWGVVTRSPRFYATTLLHGAYPNLDWNVVVGFEDVKHSKPHGEGVWQAMKETGVDDPCKVALVGDEKIDVVCAYRAGCWSFVDQNTWHPMKQEHWRALERVPDALFSGADELAALLANPYLRVPELEYLMAEEQTAGRQNRFDKINHFPPRKFDLGYVPIYVMGRLFSDYDDIQYRRAWHELTSQIIANKNADVFPAAWVASINAFILANTFPYGHTVVTVVPFKPARPPRLEALLAQVEAAYKIPRVSRIGMQKVLFLPDVLAFRDGAVSSHGNHLNAEERFANVGQNLYVKRPEDVRGKKVIVIDDVVTTGATLSWAHHYLTEADASSVICVSLTKAVGPS